MQIKKHVLLTGVRSTFALDLARKLSEQGHRVYAAETSNFHICRFSNAITKSFTIPSPRFQQARFIAALVGIAQRYHIDLIIPCFEEIFYISQALDRFPSGCSIFCSSHETLDMLHNKWLFNQKIAHLGFHSPHSHLISSAADLDALPLSPPYILKPCYSRAAQNIFKIKSSKPKITLHPNHPFIAQEWLEGDKFCSYSIAHQGHLTAHCTYPVDFAIDRSSCLSFEAIQHDAILDWVQTFVKHTHFTGQIAFDFIQLPNQNLFAIDCNPRGTSGLHLFHNVDRFSEAFLNPTLPTQYPTQGFATQIIWGMVAYGWQTLPHQKTLRHFLKKLFSTPDVIFSFKDLKPFIFQPILFLSYFLKKLRLKSCIPAIFSFDIDWNGPVPSEVEQIQLEKSS